MVHGVQSAFQLAEMQTHSPWPSLQYTLQSKQEDSSGISENTYKTI